MKLNTTIVKYVIGPLLVAIVGLAPVAYREYVEYKDNNKTKAVEYTIQAISDIETVLKDTMIYVKDLNRIVVMKSIPSPINPSFLSVLYEQVDIDTPPIRDVVQNFAVDKFHREHVILPLVISGKVTVNKETSDGYLKDVYTTYNHEFSIGHKVLNTDEYLIYVVYSFVGGTPHETTAAIRETLRGKTNKLHNIFKRVKEAKEKANN